MKKAIFVSALLLSLSIAIPAFSGERHRRDERHDYREARDHRDRHGPYDYRGDRDHRGYRPPPAVIHRPVQPRVIITPDVLVINPKGRHKGPIVIQNPFYQRY